MADVRHSVLSPFASSLVYDDLHRLTSVTYPGPSTTTYDFDAFGNREEMTTGAGTTTYDYDDADRLTEVDPPAASPGTLISMAMAVSRSPSERYSS
jgi:YD repeat-containing protein